MANMVGITGTTMSGNEKYNYYINGSAGHGQAYYTSPASAFASEQEFYNRLSEEVELMMGHLPGTSRDQINAEIIINIKKLVAEVLVPVEGLVGVTYRIKPDGYGVIAKALEKIVTSMLAGIINAKLMERAIELKKHAEGCKPSTQSDQSKPTAPLLRRTNRDLSDQWRIAEEVYYSKPQWTVTTDQISI